MNEPWDQYLDHELRIFLEIYGNYPDRVIIPAYIYENISLSMKQKCLDEWGISCQGNGGIETMILVGREYN